MSRTVPPNALRPADAMPQGAWFYLAKMAVAFLALAGFLALWRIPLQAAQQGVDPFDLILAYLDSHQGDRLYLLRADRAVIDAARERFSGTHITAARMVRKGPGEYEYTVSYDDADPVTFTTATPAHQGVAPPGLAGARGAGRAEDIDEIRMVKKGDREYEHTVIHAPPRVVRPGLEELGRPRGRDDPGGAPEGPAPAAERVTTTVTTPTPSGLFSRPAIPLEQIVEARRGMGALFPPAPDGPPREARDRALLWGEGQFEERVWEPASTGPLYEDEKLWYAWQRLTGGSRAAARDLPRLAELAHAAYPDGEGYRAAMAWAAGLYDRYDPPAGPGRGVGPAWGGPADDRPRLPKTDAVLWWLLYAHVGLNDDSRREARERWLGYLARGKAGAALGWGRQLETERRAAGEPLPPTDDNVALLCVVERLTGTDAQGGRLRRVVADTRRQVEADYPAWVWADAINHGTWYTARLVYPIDDLFYVTYSARDPLGLCAVDYSRWWPQTWWLSMLLATALLVLVMLGLREVGLTLVPAAVGLVAWPLTVALGRRRVERRLRDYVEGQEVLEEAAAFLSYVLTPLAAWAVAWYTLPVRMEVLIPGAWHLLAGVFASVCLGGTIVLLVNRALAVLLIHLGVDAERTLADEALGTVAGVVLLRYFGNDWASLGAYAVFALVPQLVLRQARVRARDAARRGAVADGAAAAASLAVIDAEVEPPLSARPRPTAGAQLTACLIAVVLLAAVAWGIYTFWSLGRPTPVAK